MRSAADRIRVAVGMVLSVMIFGTLGYWAFGFTLLDAMYQTITTITTVGFRELEEFGTAEKWFTMVLIIVGVSTVLYSFTLVVQAVVEGQLKDFVGRRRMDRQIKNMSGHSIVCGWGRVGAAVAHDLEASGERVVVVDADPERVRDVPYPTVLGDATSDNVLRDAGIERAKSLIAALDGDAANLFVTLSGRDLAPSLFIVARARSDESVSKLEHAGADRVVNPQELGAARMASFVASPNVAEFVDVVMHERSLEFRMQEFDIDRDSPIAGKTLRQANLREASGALVLALRDADGRFTTNPNGDSRIEHHHVVIAVGTHEDLARMAKLVAPA
ncbi:potassium channel family protein [Ilumatobacter coccineus]|uniref:Putative potassium channel protein n=1 Tax=Ilumatobacter coccineus (strain NBRC 103263 / KCTC 29153 / YM16-304) TaxID=1313172 RepID=A0A6C7EB82_ILUCY|nr:potassium channel protein [Ilumatobacter coccineus]BAN03640.1 putative potassium channel protein [Ilumatobacter coccineus YM16-304]